MDNSQNNFQNNFQPQQHQHYNNENPTVTTLGIVGLVLAILTMVIAFIPCFGAVAFYFGIISIIISSIGLYLAYKYQVNKGDKMSGPGMGSSSEKARMPSSA